MRKLRFLIWNILFNFLILTGAHAENEITIIVPYGVGGPQDILLRSFTTELSQALNTPIIVKNISGAGGTIGTAFVAKSLPNGKTLLFGSSGHHVAGYLYPDLTYDTLKDFTGVALFGEGGFYLTIPSNLNIDSLSEYIKLIKKNPNKYNYATPGNGSATHLAVEYFLSRFDLKMQHIPMKSASESIMEVITGRVQLALFAVSMIASTKGNEHIRFLAYTGKQRDKNVSTIPTVAEITQTDFSVEGWMGLLAPQGTPDHEIERINHAMNQVLNQPSVIERLSKLKVTATPTSVQRFNEIFANDANYTSTIFKQSNIKID